MVDQMSRLEELQCIYWDMHKEAYGFRPRGIDTSTWTEEEFIAEFEQLDAMIKADEVERSRSEALAISRFEAQVAAWIPSAGSREDAIRWIHEAEGSNGDDEFLCYLLGLPYRYFAKNFK